MCTDYKKAVSQCYGSVSGQHLDLCYNYIILQLYLLLLMQKNLSVFKGSL
jgi:hypothetical protein